jgi:hypothetical protein
LLIPAGALAVLGYVLLLWGVMVMLGTPLMMLRRSGGGWLAVLAGLVIELVQWVVACATGALLGCWLPGYLWVAWTAVR